MTSPARPTIHDVARLAGVSVPTVSKVLNGRDGVAARTAERVQAAVVELGYVTSITARSLRQQRTNVLGVLVADLEPFSAEVLKGVADVLRGTNYELVAYAAATRVEEHIGWERRHLSRLGGTLIDGAVIVTPTVTDIPRPVPVVAVDPTAGPEDLPTVDAENLHGGRLAAQHLIELGHTRIAMLTGRPDLVSARQREEGFREVFKEAGVEVDESLFVPGDYDPEVATASARELLARDNRPTAIFASNDATALATLAVADELGVRVPDDLSLIGFDNVPETMMSNPPLTTVEQPIREMGRRAAQMLLDQLGGAEAQTSHVRLPTKLVVRASTAAPRA